MASSPTHASNKTGAHQTRTIQSLERAFSIIDVVSRSPNPLSLSEVSGAVKLHPSTAFHLLRTLCSVGALSQEADKRYRIGAYIYGLAAGAMSERNLISNTRPELEKLAKQTGETAHIAVMSKENAVILNRVEGSSPVAFAERIGSLRPAYCTAIGRVLLAQKSDAAIEVYLGKTPLTAMTSHTQVRPEQIQAEIEKVRQLGYAYEDQELNPEIRCVAAPVYGFTGEAVMAIGISAPTYRLLDEKIKSMADEVKRAAENLSQVFGRPS